MTGALWAIEGMMTIDLRTRLGKLREDVLDLVFPPRCIGCGSEGDYLCAGCADSLSPLEQPVCHRCGNRLIDGQVCRKCLGNEWVIDGIRSPFLHLDMARETVHQFKYRNMKVLSKPMARLMAQAYTSDPLPADMLMAVPAHPRRLRQRGYNQAQLLAEQLQHSLGLPISSGTLIRSVNTRSQVSLGARDRQANMREAFQCREQFLYNRGILLIDDVCTTGATLNACAAALKMAGASAVWGLTFSREF